MGRRGVEKEGDGGQFSGFYTCPKKGSDLFGSQTHDAVSSLPWLRRGSRVPGTRGNCGGQYRRALTLPPMYA
jgi:hypothetical protein